MAKPDTQKRIEGVFGNIGLGNTSAERVAEIVEQYERAMTTAEWSKPKRGKKRFRDVLAKQEEKPEEKKKP